MKLGRCKRPLAFLSWDVDFRRLTAGKEGMQFSLQPRERYVKVVFHSVAMWITGSLEISNADLGLQISRPRQVRNLASPCRRPRHDLPAVVTCSRQAVYRAGWTQMVPIMP